VSAAMTTTEALALALEMARTRDVFPIALSRSTRNPRLIDKRPLTNHGHEDASRDPAVLGAAFTAGAGRLRAGEVIGVGHVPASMNAVVLDLDQHEEGRDGVAYGLDVLKLPPYTQMVRTATGDGVHAYYLKRDPAAVVTNRSPWAAHGVDVRADNGWVVAPGTRTPWGDWTPMEGKPTTMAQLPADKWDALMGAAAKAEAERATEVAGEPVDADDVPATLRAMLDDLGPSWMFADAAAPSGRRESADRSRRFHRLVGDCQRGGFTQGQAVTLLTPWCEGVDKYVGRVPSMVAGSWGKIAADAEGEPATDSPPASDGSTAAESTWRPVDLSDVLDGTYEPETAALMPRSDGVHLIYAGRLHSFHGESESGKSLAAQAECARVLTEGGAVLYVDFESDKGTVVGRMLAMGANRDDIRARFDYVRPDAGLRAPADRAAFDELLGRTYALAVVDGVTEALALLADPAGDIEGKVIEYVTRLPRRIARQTGAAVIQVDHVTKSTESRGRFALGSQHKMNSLDGAAYTVEVAEPLGLGLRGVVVLRIAKDRPGTLRPQCGAFRKSDRTQEAARIVFDATTPGRTVVTVEPPTSHVGAESTEHGGFRPTMLMERVSRHLEGQLEPLSLRAVTDHVTGKGPALRAALDCLVTEGYATRTPGPRGSHLHVSVTAYRQADDPRSDRFEHGDTVEPIPTASVPPSDRVTVSPTTSGDTGHSQTVTLDRVPGHAGTQSGHAGTQSEVDYFDSTRDPWSDPPMEPIHACAGDVCRVVGCASAVTV